MSGILAFASTYIPRLIRENGGSEKEVKEFNEDFNRYGEEIMNELKYGRPHDFKLDANVQDASRKTALMLAVEKRDTKITTLLMNDERVNVNVRYEHGNTLFSTVLKRSEEHSDILSQRNNEDLSIIIQFLKHTSLRIEADEKELLLSLFAQKNHDRMHSRFARSLLIHHGDLIPEALKQTCLRDATRACNGPLIMTLLNTTKSIRFYEQSLLYCMLTLGDQSSFMKLTKKANLKDILISFLRSKPNTHFEQRDVSFLLNAVRKHDFYSYGGIYPDNEDVNQVDPMLHQSVPAKYKNIPKKQNTSLTFCTKK